MSIAFLVIIIILITAFGAILGSYAGIGGGTILSALFIFTYSYATNISDPIKFSALVSLFAVFSITSTSFLLYQKKHISPQWTLIGSLSGGGIVGGVIGSFYISSFFSNNHLWLYVLYIAMLLIIGSLTIMKNRIKLVIPESWWIPSSLLIGVLIGLGAGGFGIGGSVLILPILLIFFNLPLKKAIQTTLICTLLITTSSIITHLSTTNFTTMSSYWWVFIIIPIASIGGSYLGVKLNHRSSHKLVLSVFIIIIALMIILLLIQLMLLVI